MVNSQRAYTTRRALAYGAGLFAGAWLTYAAATWLRYGHIQEAVNGEQDPLLGGFMPAYEVVERHHVRVGAPRDMTFRAACEVDLQRSPLINAIFRGREL